MVAKSRTDIRGGRFEAPRPPEGLSGKAGDLPWLGLRLADRQERAFLNAGLKLAKWEQASSGAWVLVREDAAITAEAVQLLIEEGDRRGEDLAWRSGGRLGGLAEELFLGPEEPLLVFNILAVSNKDRRFGLPAYGAGSVGATAAAVGGDAVGGDAVGGDAVGGDAVGDAAKLCS